MPQSILLLFESSNQRSTLNQDQVATGFMRLHGLLFTQGVTHETEILAGSFLSKVYTLTLRSYDCLAGKPFALCYVALEA